MITIHYDYTDGTEVSYIEGEKLGNNFTTCCLDFFCFDYLKQADDIMVLKKNGDYLSAKKMIDGNHNYTKRDIRFGHNIRKILVAGGFLDEYWDKG